MTPSDEEIRTKTQQTFGKRPCQFQIDLCKAQLERKSIISVAATGSGKTLSYFMPLQFSSDSLVIIVTALNVLGEQFVAEALTADLSAVFVNADNNSNVIFQEIKAVKYRVVIMSPNVFSKRGGHCQTMLWNDAKFVPKMDRIVFDEGHCIIHV